MTREMQQVEFQTTIYRRYIKRMIDFILALIALIILSPVLLGIALLVRLKLGSPIIFKQERVGKDEKIFMMYKFRTMTDKRDEQGELVDDRERLTQFGSILRATSLDELPEIFNILKGDMSLIGPRPLLVKYLPYYTTEEHWRHHIRPGLTGLAQVSGRNLLNWEEKFALDLQYVEKYSWRCDLQIFFATIKKVVCHEDVTDFQEVGLHECRVKNEAYESREG